MTPRPTSTAAFTTCTGCWIRSTVTLTSQSRLTTPARETFGSTTECRRFARRSTTSTGSRNAFVSTSASRQRRPLRPQAAELSLLTSTPTTLQAFVCLGSAAPSGLRSGGFFCPAPRRSDRGRDQRRFIQVPDEALQAVEPDDHDRAVVIGWTRPAVAWH